MATPASILNIGAAGGQNHFSVQVAEEGAADIGGTGATGPVQYRDSSSASSSDGTSLPVTKPAGVTEGDLMIAFSGSDADGDLASLTAAGWEQIGSSSGASRIPPMKVWQKIAGASEPASYSFGDSDSSNAIAGIIAFFDYDPDQPLAATPVFNASATNATAQAAPSVAGVAGGMLVTAHLADTQGAGSSSYTPPGGMTERQDQTTRWVVLEINTQELNADGATGAKTATCSRSSDYNCVALVIAPPPAQATPGNWLAFF